MVFSAGLIVKENDSFPPARLPPKAVHVEVKLIERVAQHRLVQTFANAGSSQLQAAYVFPLVDGAAVFGYQACFSSGRKISCEVRERNEARQMFQKAADQGLCATMLEEESMDVFRTSIGSLDPGEEVEVELQWCLELELINGSMRLTIPSHVAPRYSPAEQSSTRESTIHWYSSNAPEAEFTATVLAEMAAHGAAKIESPTHPTIAVHHSHDTSRTTAELKTKGLQTDIVFIVTPADIFQPVVVREVLEACGTEALMLSLVPELSGMTAQRIEVVFVLDCSGSMSGRRVEQAKRATQIFLRSLPADCLFNIVLFGSSFKTLYAEGSSAYSEASLKEATTYVDTAAANMGGTEILAPLRFVMNSECIPNAQRQIILLTDGQVSNQTQVFDLVRSMGCRVFSIGIGSGVSTALVNGLARATNGSAAFVQDNEKLEPVCVSMLKKATSPSVSNIVVSWPDSTSFRSQTKPPPIFPGEGFSGFALYPSGALLDHAVVTLTGSTPNGEVKFEISVPATAKVIGSGQPAILHKMFARSLIRDVEEAEYVGQTGMTSYKAEAIQLSLQHAVLCSYTAFVGVERSSDGSTERAFDIDASKQKTRQDQRQLFSSGCASTGNPFKCNDGLASLEAKISSLKSISSQIDNEVSTMSRQAVLLKCSRHRSSSRVKAGVTNVLSRISNVLRHVAAFARKISSRATEQSAAAFSDQYPSTARDKPLSSSTLGNPTSVNHALRLNNVIENKGLKAKNLERLLRLARFDGSFTHSVELEKLTGVDLKSIALWAEEEWGKSIEGDILVTARVLACLRFEFADDHTTWELVAHKATDWLHTKQCEWSSSRITSVNTLLSVAASPTGVPV